MNIGDLRKAVQEMAELPDETPVKIVSRRGTVRPVERVWVNGLHGFVAMSEGTNKR